MKPSEYTICITNFSRPDHLRRCLQSVAKCKYVVVASYEATDEHRKIIEEERPGCRCYLTPEDHGQNRLLIQAVALARTPWVVILHDDDQLTDNFVEELEKVDPTGCNFIGWDGLTEWFDDTRVKRVYPWKKIKQGAFPSTGMIASVTQPHGGMVRSPVTMMLRKDTALAVLSWCEEGLRDFHTRPKMTIGNEIALLYGHLITGTKWYHIDKPLVKFGHWEGSETVKWLNGENPELVNLYDKVRVMLGESFDFYNKTPIPTIVHIMTSGGDNPRKNLAKETWEDEYRDLEKDWVVVPVVVDEKSFSRTSEKFGDSRKMPFIRDMLKVASSFCNTDNDVVMLTNDDICFSPGGLRAMVDETLEKGCTYSHRREFTGKALESIGLKRISRKLTLEEIRKGGRHTGTDVILMTRKWWKDIGAISYPDMLVGCEAWDSVMIVFMREHNAGSGFCNTTYHEYHKTFWSLPENRTKNLGQVYNRSLATRFFTERGKYVAENIGVDGFLEKQKIATSQDD